MSQLTFIFGLLSFKRNLLKMQKILQATSSVFSLMPSVDLNFARFLEDSRTKKDTCFMHILQQPKLTLSLQKKRKKN